MMSNMVLGEETQEPKLFSWLRLEFLKITLRVRTCLALRSSHTRVDLTTNHWHTDVRPCLDSSRGPNLILESRLGDFRAGERGGTSSFCTTYVVACSSMWRPPHHMRDLLPNACGTLWSNSVCQALRRRYGYHGRCGRLPNVRRKLVRYHVLMSCLARQPHG